MNNQDLPDELVELIEAVKKLGYFQRKNLLPLLNSLVHYTRIQAQIIRMAQAAVDQLLLDIKYFQFDIEVTRRERDSLRSLLSDCFDDIDEDDYDYDDE